MLLSWWRNRRRRKILARPFPSAWEDILDQSVGHYGRLTPQERQRLKRCVQIVIAEKYWEGCNGQAITDEVRVTIAGQACLLLIGFPNQHFESVKTILVYPDRYVAKNTQHHPGGVVSESADLRLGEAWYRGPVILSWSTVLANSRNPHDGQNVVLHEFAHVLDMQDQVFDGTPNLQSAEQFQTWQDVMTGEFNRHVQNATEGRATLLDAYGATNEAEFFAVATECFFEQPGAMKRRHRDLYDTLQSFYRQDPAARMEHARVDHARVGR